ASSCAAPSNRLGFWRINLLSSASPPILWHVRQICDPTFPQTSSIKNASTALAQPPVYGFFSSPRTAAPTSNPVTRTRISERPKGMSALVRRQMADKSEAGAVWWEAEKSSFFNGSSAGLQQQLESECGRVARRLPGFDDSLEGGIVEGVVVRPYR